MMKEHTIIESENQKESMSPKENSETIEKIQTAYINCITLGDDFYFQELMEMIDLMCSSWIVNRIISAKKYYDEGFIKEVMQEARLNLWLDIKKTRELKLEPKPTYGWYAYGIYKHCVMNELKKYFSKRNSINLASFSLDVMKELGKEISIGTDDISITNTVGKKTIVNNVDKEEKDAVLEEERVIFYSAFLDEYLRTLMNSEESPENCLAVMYARILPHVLDDLRDSIMASVRWARERMGMHNIDFLTKDSESDMVNNGFSFYKWGSEYLKQLDKAIFVETKEYRVRDVIYIEAFDKGRDIEHMDRDTHRNIQRKAFKQLISDPKFISLGMEYMELDDRMYKLLGGIK